MFRKLGLLSLLVFLCGQARPGRAGLPFWLDSPSGRSNPHDPKNPGFIPSATPVQWPTLPPLASASASPTGGPSDTATPTATSTPAVSDTGSPTAGPSPSASPTATPSLPSSPTQTFTLGPAGTDTDSPTATATPTASATSSPSFSASPTATATPSFTSSPTATVSATATPSSTATPSPTPTPLPTAGATVPYVEYEAENASYTGTLLGPSTTMILNGAGTLATEMAAESSGRQAVELTAQGQQVSFNATAGFNSIVVRYIIPDASGGGGINATLSLYINGSFVQELNMTSRYSWDYKSWTYPYDKNPADGSPFHLYDETRALLASSYPAGSTVTLKVGPSDTASYYVIDLVDLEQVAPALSQPAGSLSVSSYGATGNGSTDDTTAINNCISAAESSGKVVWFPAGTYLLTGSLNITTGVSLQGAGMWYSTLHETSDVAILALNLNNASFYVGDLSLFGEVVNRNDSVSDNGINGHGGTGSTVKNVWIEHTKCGWWVGNVGSVTGGLTVTGCRVRDTYADGINFCNGTSNSTVTQCQFRNTGDDAVASWSPSGGGVNSGNTFSYDTVQCPWRADGFALYGGSNNNIENDVCLDTLDQAGIMVEQGFSSNAFGGTNTISNNTLTRCGGQFNGRQYGALYFWGNQSGLGGSFPVSGLSIASPTYMGIGFGGANNAGGETFDNVQIDSAGTYGIQVDSTASGSASFSNTVLTNPFSKGLNNLSSSFTINQVSGNSGW